MSKNKVISTPKTIKDDTRAADDKAILKTLFPYAVVPLGDGTDRLIKVVPLTLENISFITEAFSRLISVAGSDRPSLLRESIGELQQLIPYCVKTPDGMEVKDIPLYILPSILDVIVEQNLTDDAVGKWVALVQGFTDLVGKSKVQSAQ